MTARHLAEHNIAPAFYQIILTNRTDGASALFQQFAELAEEQPPEIVQEGLRACQGTFPLMAVWPYALGCISKGESLQEVAAEMARQTQATVDRGVAALQDYPAILTLSNSSLVRRTIINCGQRPGPVYCAESQPGGEGRVLAESLQQEGIEALLVTDEQALRIAAEVDAVLLGADQYDDAGFINKVGSKRLAERAGELSKPVLVLAEGFKQVAQLPRLTPELAQLEVNVGGQASFQTVFERIPWLPHIRLVTDAA